MRRNFKQMMAQITLEPGSGERLRCEICGKVSSGVFILEIIEREGSVVLPTVGDIMHYTCYREQQEKAKLAKEG